MKRLLWSLAVAGMVVGVIVILFAFGFGRNPNIIASPLIDRPAPPFVLQRIDGGRVALTSLRGRPIVLNFWASWCVGCHQEHPYLVQAYHRWGKRVTFLGIVFEDSTAAARAYLRQHGGGWLNLADPDSKTAISYGVSGVPETFFIDRRGIIVAKQPGPVTLTLLNQRIHELLLEGKHENTRR
jgi:cytochrome c biogenesis protein CcmG/thiol:disulfide interchange protein DsbE